MGAAGLAGAAAAGAQGCRRLRGCCLRTLGVSGSGLRPPAARPRPSPNVTWTLRDQGWLRVLFPCGGSCGLPPSLSGESPASLAASAPGLCTRPCPLAPCRAHPNSSGLSSHVSPAERPPWPRQLNSHPPSPSSSPCDRPHPVPGPLPLSAAILWT